MISDASREAMSDWLAAHLDDDLTVAVYASTGRIAEVRVPVGGYADVAITADMVPRRRWVWWRRQWPLRLARAEITAYLGGRPAVLGTVELGHVRFSCPGELRIGPLSPQVVG